MVRNSRRGIACEICKEDLEGTGPRPGHASNQRAERSSRRGRRAGGPPPTGASSSTAENTKQREAARPHRGRAAGAVALGFEPRVAVTPHSISSAAPSAARTRYLTRILYYTDPRSTQIDRAGWEQGHTTPAARRPGAHEQARTPMGASAVSETGLARVHTKRHPQDQNTTTCN